MNLRQPKTEYGHLWRTLIIGAVLVVLVTGGFLWYQSARSGLDADRYQIVTLITGERYIGNLSKLNAQYVVLDNVYYQQEPPSQSDESAADETQITVLRLSDTVAQPDNTMHISRDKLVHWENLSNDSKVVQVIRQDADGQ